MSVDRGNDDDDNGVDGADTAGAAFFRALIKLPSRLFDSAKGYLRLPKRVPSRQVAQAADRASTVADVYEAVAAKGGLRAAIDARSAFLKTGGGIVVTIAKATAMGTLLFSVFEEASARGTMQLQAFYGDPLAGNVPPRRALADPGELLLPFCCGALAGATHGIASVSLDTLGPKMLENLRKAPFFRTSITDAAEWSVAFGVFLLLRRVLVTEVGHRIPAVDADEDENAHALIMASIPSGIDAHETATGEEPSFASYPALTFHHMASVGTAALGGGLAQSLATKAMHDSPINLRGVAIAAIGLLAFDFSRDLESE